MPIRTFTTEHLRATGSLKWTGITRSDGSPTLGAWVAEMDFGTAPEVEEAITRAIHDGFLGYPPPWLTPRLQEATANFQARRFGWDISPDAVRSVPAVLPALVKTIEHLTKPGSAVIVPTPAYMPFLTIPGLLNRRVIEVPSLHGVHAGGVGWRLDLTRIEDALKAGAGLVILCNPWNPTGRVLSEEELRAVYEVVSRYDALVFSDEIHSPLILDETPFISYARLGEEFAAHTVTATAATKGWNTAGLPNAQVILTDPDLRARWDGIPHGVDDYPVSLGVLGTIAAYEKGEAWLDEVIALIRKNTHGIQHILSTHNIDYTPPQATYLTWWGMQNHDFGDLQPATYIREYAGVAVNAGKTLGEDWNQWIRVNLACSLEAGLDIVDRIVSALPEK